MNTSLKSTIAKIVLGALAISQFAFLAPVANAFSDVDSSSWYAVNVQDLVDAGVIDGTASMFRPADNFNRAELAKVTFKIGELSGTVNNPTGAEVPPLPAEPYTKFNDVPTSAWFAPYVYQLVAQNILTGYKDAAGNLTGNFGPGDAVNRAAMTKAFTIASGLAVQNEAAPTLAPFTDVPVDHWAAPFVNVAKDNCVVMGMPDGMFHPNDLANRAQMAKVADKTLNPGCDTNTNMNASNSNTNAPASLGNVTAAISSDNPASGVIVGGQATAELLKVTFTGNGTVNSAKFKRSGISDQNTLTNVYLYDGVNRLTDGYSFNSNGEFVVNGLGLQVNGSRTISVRADVACTIGSPATCTSGTASGQTIAVSLVNYGGVDTAINGNLFSVASGGTLAQIGLSGANGVAATGLPGVNAGTSSYAVWRQSFQVNTRTIQLKAANFRISGSAPKDALANIGLYVDGAKTSANATMTTANGSNYITFDFMASPFSLNTGSHSFEVRGDIVKGSSFNFTVALQQASDLMVFDPQVGVNIAVCGDTTCSTAFSASTAGQINIGAGSVTLVQDPTFTTMTNVTAGASNVTIAKFKAHAYGEDVKITSLPVKVALSAAATPAGIQNVTLYFNGSQIGTQVSPSSASGVAYTTSSCTLAGVGFTCYSNTFSLGSQLVIPAGVDSFIEVRADLRNAAGANYTTGTVAANLGAGVGEGQNSKSSVTTSAAAGNSLTMQTGLLAVAKNAGYANQTQNPNTAAIKIGSYVLQNTSSSESVRVTNFTATISTNTAAAYTALGLTVTTNLSGLKTSETSGSASTPVQPQATNSFSTDFTLAPGATKTVDILADAGSATGVDVFTTLAVTGIGTTSNSSVTVSAVTGQTITLSSGTLGTPTLTSSSSTTSQYIAAAGGATDASKGTFSFVSTGGAATISELKVTLTGTLETLSGQTSSSVTNVKVGSVSAPVVCNGVLCQAWLQGLALAVPNGGSGIDTDIFLSYAPVGTSGTTPASTSTATLAYVKYSSGGTTSTLSPSVNANQMTLVGSKPTVTISSTQASGLNISGVGKIGEVTVTADAKGNIKLNKIRFTISSSGFSSAPTAVAGTVISDNNSSSTPITNAVCTPTALVVVCTLDTDANGSLINFDGYSIAAGTSKTLSLFGSLTGAAAIGSGTPTITSSVDAANFNWDDSSTNGASGTNLTGSLIYGFPNNSYSIKQ